MLLLAESYLFKSLVVIGHVFDGVALNMHVDLPGETSCVMDTRASEYLSVLQCYSRDYSKQYSSTAFHVFGVG